MFREHKLHEYRKRGNIRVAGALAVFAVAVFAFTVMKLSKGPVPHASDHVTQPSLQD